MNESHLQESAPALAEMERQHRELHGILDALHGRAGQARPAADLERLLLLFEDHSQGHFQAEEALMRRSGYDSEAYRRHCRDHREILGNVRALLSVLHRGGTGSREFESTVERELISGLERHMQWDEAVMLALR